jgi:hypothetical protein
MAHLWRRLESLVADLTPGLTFCNRSRAKRMIHVASSQALLSIVVPLLAAFRE